MIILGILVLCSERFFSITDVSNIDYHPFKVVLSLSISLILIMVTIAVIRIRITATRSNNRHEESTKYDPSQNPSQGNGSVHSLSLIHTKQIEQLIDHQKQKENVDVIYEMPCSQNRTSMTTSENYPMFSLESKMIDDPLKDERINDSKEHIVSIKEGKDIVESSEEKSAYTATNTNQVSLRDITSRLHMEIKSLKPFSQIRISPPTKEDPVITIPIDCSFSSKCIGILYLLRNHTVTKRIINQYGLLEITVSIKETNQELLLLAYGQHNLRPNHRDIHGIFGKNLLAEDYEKIINSSVIITLINEGKKILNTPFSKTEEEERDFSNAIRALNNWIKKVSNTAFVRYTGKAVSSFWKSEFRLYMFIKMIYPDSIFQYHSDCVYGVPKRNADRPAGGNYAAAGGNVNRRKREFLVRRQAVDLN